VKARRPFGLIAIANCDAAATRTPCGDARSDHAVQEILQRRAMSWL